MELSVTITGTFINSSSSRLTSKTVDTGQYCVLELLGWILSTETLRVEFGCH